MKLWIYKSGWQQHVGVRFPRMEFWGLLTIMGMLAKSNEIVQIASSIFIFTGIWKWWQQKTVVQEKKE